MDLKSAFTEEEQAYLLRTRKSDEVYQAARQVMPGGDTRTTVFYHPYPLTMSHGSGPELHDADGNTYLDFLNNYTSTIHGHAHPRIVQSALQALHAGTASASIAEEQITLARMLINRIPGKNVTRRRPTRNRRPPYSWNEKR